MKHEKQCLRNILIISGDPPVITEAPLDSIEERGNSVTFSCTAEGNGTLNITWRLPSGEEVFTGINMEKDWRINSSLTVDDISGDDGGNYTCIAGNEAGCSEANATLSVRLYTNEALVMPILTTTNGTVERLFCPIEGFPVDYIWQRGMEPSGSRNMTSGSGSSSGSSGNMASGSGSSSGSSGNMTSESGNSSSSGSMEPSSMSGNMSGSGLTPEDSSAFGNISGSGLMNTSGLTPDDTSASGNNISGNSSDSDTGDELEYTTINFGRVLEFDPAMFGDEGVYRCVATSELGETLISDPTTVTSE